VTDFLWRCDRGPQLARLFARIGAEILCADCWHAAGEPWPPPGPPTAEQLAEIERRMLRRGGSDRYRVLAGKA
jgi:hypothetical protein